jgi:molybdopterin synthase catalytic subunit
VFSIVAERIKPRNLEQVVRKRDGGVVTFLGIVRDRDAEGRSVTALFYEAYEAMAIEEFKAIAREANERFGDAALAIVHRVGLVPAGEISIAVCAAAEHRERAFDACRYAIDEVKRRAPIWKQEHYAGALPQWKENLPR